MFPPYRTGEIIFQFTRAHEKSTIPFFCVSQSYSCFIFMLFVLGLGKGFPGTGNIGPKTAGNREYWLKNSREQGTCSKTAGNREHWLKNSREQGTLVLKQPGTGNTGLKTAGNREHKAKKSREQGTFRNSNHEFSTVTMTIQETSLCFSANLPPLHETWIVFFQ